LRSGKAAVLLRATTLLIFLLPACSVPLGAEPTGVWLDVPFVKQEKEGCGAASVAMLMQYWLQQQGKAPTESADAANILKKLHSTQGKGIFVSDLERYLHQQGFETFAFAGNWESVGKHLHKGRPLIVATQEGGINEPLHYVVMTGIDPGRRLISVNDPARRKLLKWDRATFEKQWSAAGYWTLLVVPQHLER